MSLKEDIKEIRNEVNETSFAMEMIQFVKTQTDKHGKRLFILLIIILSLWFATIGGFMYYITNYTTEITTEEANTNDGGNACVGDNCYNGDIDYGESEKSN